MDIKKIQENIKDKVDQAKKSLQGVLSKIKVKKKPEVNPDQETEGIEPEGKTSKIKIDPNAGEKKGKHNFTEQDLKRKKIIQIIVVIALAVFLFVEDEEIVQKVQEGVEQVKSKSGEVIGAEGTITENETNDPYEQVSGTEVQAETRSEIGTEGINDQVEVGSDSGQIDSMDNTQQLDEVKKEITVENRPKKKPRKRVKKTRKKKDKKNSLVDLAKEIEKKAEEESRKKVYKSVNYLKVGRGLAYNCQKKFWACLNKREYFNCKDNLEHLDLNKKSRECFPLEVYSSVRDCKIIQIHKINTIEQTDFCKGQ